MQRFFSPAGALARPMRLAVASVGAAFLLHGAASAVRAAADPTLLPSIVSLVRNTDDPQFQLDVLRGLSAAYQNQPSFPMPAGWGEVETRLGTSTNSEIRSLVRLLSLKFGSPTALAALRRRTNRQEVAR